MHAAGATRFTARVTRDAGSTSPAAAPPPAMRQAGAILAPTPSRTDRMLRFPNRWLVAALLMLLAACGNKGDLVRPSAPADAAPAPAAAPR